MRHLGLRLAIGALALAGGIDECATAPLDFLFGGPPLASRPAYRLRRRPAPPPRAPLAEIPLPVQRPRFPGDPPAGTTAPAQAPPRANETVKPNKTPGPSKGAEVPDQAVGPVGTAPPASASAAPLPPAKPDDLAKPAGPGTIEPPAKPDAPKPETPKPETPKLEAPGSEPSTSASPSPAPPPAPALPTQPPSPPAKPPDVAKPGPSPTVAPSGATTSFTPRSPGDDPECPSRLVARKVGVEKISIGPQPDERCTVVEPVRLTELGSADGGKVSFPERPTIACTTADAFSSYVRDLLVPLAKGTFGAPVVAVWTGPGLECRSRDHIFGAKLSAHGQGLAIDIAQLKLADGRLIEVGTPKADAETAFETAARAGACGYFHTVLGPGSDSYHRTHWHFDLEVRGGHGDGKYCR